MSYFQQHGITQRLLNTTFLSACLVLIGLGGLYFSTIIRNPYTVLYPLALILGAVCFLLLKSNSSLSDLTWAQNTGKPVLIGFFAVLSLLVVQYHAAGFWRTDVVFYFTFSLYILAGSYIITGGRTPIALLLVFVAGLTTRITALYASSEYVGIDIYFHTKLIQSIVGEGTLKGFATTKYFYAPFYHIQAAQGQLLFDVGTKDALTFTTMLSVIIIPALVVFLVTKRFWSRKIALLASLLYTGSDEAINWGVRLIPSSLGIAFFSISLLSLLLYYVKGDKRIFVVFVGAIAALMHTHQISLFISSTLVLGFSLAIIAYTFQLPAKVAHILLFTGFAVQIDFMVTKYSGPAGSTSLFQNVLGRLVTRLIGAEISSRPEVAFPADPNISPGGAAAMADIQLAGSALLLFFAILGALFWLHSHKGTIAMFVALCMGVGVTMLMVVTLVFPMIGIRSLIPSRWWAFTYILLTIFAAPGLVFFANYVGSVLPRPEVAIPILLASLLIPFIVLMGGAAVASADNPFINEGFSAERLSVTDTEQALGEYTNRYGPESIRIVSDNRYPYTSGTVRMDYYDPQSLASEDPVLVANREYMSTKPAMYEIRFENRTPRVFGGVPIGKLNPGYKSTIYDNGDDNLLLVQED